jgi:hypothetical protein
LTCSDLPTSGAKHARDTGSSSARRSGNACGGVCKRGGQGAVNTAMTRSTSSIGRSGRSGAALTTTMVFVAMARGWKWSASILSVRGTTGSARAATRATETGRSVRGSCVSNYRCRNPESSTTSSRARASTVMRHTGCRLCGSPGAEAAGYRGTGGVHCARPGLWGGRRVTGAFTRKATAYSVRSCLAPAASRA